MSTYLLYIYRKRSVKTIYHNKKMIKFNKINLYKIFKKN